MLSDLSPNARALADYMSSLSEGTWCAGWLLDLEFMLWSALVVENFHGRLALTDAEVEHLRSLSGGCQGWIVFHENTEETFVPLPEWLRLFADWHAANTKGRANR